MNGPAVPGFSPRHDGRPPGTAVGSVRLGDEGQDLRQAAEGRVRSQRERRQGLREVSLLDEELPRGRPFGQLLGGGPLVVERFGQRKDHGLRQGFELERRQGPGKCEGKDRRDRSEAAAEAEATDRLGNRTAVMDGSGPSDSSVPRLGLMAEVLTRTRGVETREKLVVTVDEHGNTSAASIPLALDTGVRDGRIKPGQLLLFEALGGGFAWGAALVRY